MISLLDTALTAARQTLVIVNDRAERQGFYNGAGADMMNSHADLRAVQDMLIKAAQHAGTPQAWQKAGTSGGFLQLAAAWGWRLTLRTRAGRAAVAG